MRFGILSAFLCLAACSGPSPQDKLAPPGRAERWQIYALEDASRPDPWAFPDTEALGQRLQARVERKQVRSLEEAEAQLREWTARPVDVILLGRALPQQAWQKLRPSRVERRIVLALSPPSEGDWLPLNVRREAVQRLMARFCELDVGGKGCLVGGPAAPDFAHTYKSNARKLLILGSSEWQERGEAPSGVATPHILSLQVDWVAFLSGLFAQQQRDGKWPAAIPALDFASGHVIPSLRGRGSAKEGEEKISAMLKSFKLQELGSGK